MVKREMMSTNERLVMLEKYVDYLHEALGNANGVWIPPIYRLSLDKFIEQETNNGSDDSSEAKT